MADSVVSYLWKNLPQIASYLQQEFKLPGEVAEQMNSLQNQLKILIIILHISGGKHNGHQMVKEIISRIRDAVYETEDVIDTYIYKNYRQRTKKWWDLANYVDHSMALHDLSSKMAILQKKIDEIKQAQKEYGVELIGHVDNWNAEEETAVVDFLHERRGKVEEDDVVGFEDYSEKVIKKLIGGSQQLDIISIFGMGGLGKTTLARKIYRNNRVKQYFNCFAWTTVSNDFEAKDILLGLLRQVTQGVVGTDIQEKSTNELVTELYKNLEGKKYLIVLDDVWKPEAWVAMERAFPDNQKRSRILITSRSKAVANHVSASHNKYHLPFLSEEKAWELFSKRVFRGEECPLELKDLAEQMAKSCDGLPLSIVVLAGLLLNVERSRVEWSMVAGNEILHLYNEKEKCSDILALSYHYLPPKLKPCFLYVGLYSEDYEIPARQLILQWVAEGFITEDTGKKLPEDIAEFYLQQLIDRSLIQVAGRRIDGGVKTCRIHDLLRVLCIQESKEDNFFHVYTGHNSNNLIQTKPRRLSLYSSVSSYLSVSSTYNTDQSSVRSLISFGLEEFLDKETCVPCSKDEDKRFWESLTKTFNLLRVLHIKSRGNYILPDDIEKLSLLRYLRVNAASLSNGISKLLNLETLDMREKEFVDLPFSFRSVPIWKLKRLRQLFTPGPATLPPFHEPLINLQSLQTVDFNNRMAQLLTNAMFPNLRKLGLYIKQNAKCGKVNELWQSLQKLSHLQTLKIIDRDDGDIVFPQEASWFPSTLTKITIQSSDINRFCPELRALGAISNLEILKVRTRNQYVTFGPYDDRNVHSKEALSIECVSESFKSLRVFKVQGFLIKDWYLSSSAMPLLQSLVFDECDTWRELPDKLLLLKNLKDVQVLHSTTALRGMVRKQRTNDGCLVTIQ